MGEQRRLAVGRSNNIAEYGALLSAIDWACSARPVRSRSPRLLCLLLWLTCGTHCPYDARKKRLTEN